MCRSLILSWGNAGLVYCWAPSGQMDRADGGGGMGRRELIGMWQRPKLQPRVLCSGGGGVPGVFFPSRDGTPEDDLQRTGVWVLEEGTLIETDWYVSQRLLRLV